MLRFLAHLLNVIQMMRNFIVFKALEQLLLLPLVLN